MESHQKLLVIIQYKTGNNAFYLDVSMVSNELPDLEMKDQFMNLSNSLEVYLKLWGKKLFHPI